MTWLAIDTATDRASVAVERGGAVERAALAGARKHARALPGLIGDALTAAGASLADLRGVAVADGPGSFTGLRVGAAVAKAIVHARRLPLWTAPSLLARAHAVAPHDGRLVVVLADALRGDVYVAAYRLESGSVHTVLAPTVLRPEQVRERCGAADVIVSTASAGALAAVRGNESALLIEGDAALPDAAALLALRTMRGGAAPVRDVAAWEPDYGRPAEAQVRWEETHGRPLPHPARPLV